jgi:hypothetical protein
LHKKILKLFIEALICPNDLDNTYSGENYDSPKQLYMMWILQMTKRNNWIDSNSIIPEMREQEKIVIMELEA